MAIGLAHLATLCVSSPLVSRQSLVLGGVLVAEVQLVAVQHHFEGESRARTGYVEDGLELQGVLIVT